MADKTNIEWTDATWNPITGCSVVSPGCKRCYAMKVAGTRLAQHPSRKGLTVNTAGGPVWTGEVRLNEGWLSQPTMWARPRRIFVCAHGDLFHENVPDEWLDTIFALMALNRRHTFQVLTKRPARMREYIEGLDGYVRGVEEPIAWPLPNVWLGVSAEDQARADERIPELLATPAAVRFLSAEPLLEAIDLRPWLSDDDGCESCDDGEGLAPTRCSRPGIPRAEQCPTRLAVFRTDEGPVGPDGAPEWIVCNRERLDWVIVGGESGSNARPMHPDWARQLRDQCTSAGVAFFFKQWGTWATLYDRDREDPDWRTAGDLPIKWPNGRWLNLAGGHGFHGERVVYVAPLGKNATKYRPLDGVVHHAMPEVPGG